MMDRTPDENFGLLFEAAKRSLIASDTLLKRLAADVASLEADINSGIDVGDRAISPLLSSISFIDFSHRFASLMDALPKVNKKTLAMRKLNEVMKPVEDARNHLQHMRGDFAKDVDINYPILGSLSWTNGEQSFQLSWSQHLKHRVYSVIYDVANKRWLAKHQYAVKDTAVNLDGVMQEMHATFSWLISECTFPNPNDALIRWGETQAWTMNVNFERLPPSTPVDFE